MSKAKIRGAALLATLALHVAVFYALKPGDVWRKASVEVGKPILIAAVPESQAARLAYMCPRLTKVEREAKS